MIHYQSNTRTRLMCGALFIISSSLICASALAATPRGGRGGASGGCNFSGGHFNGGFHFGSGGFSGHVSFGGPSGSCSFHSGGGHHRDALDSDDSCPADEPYISATAVIDDVYRLIQQLPDSEQGETREALAMVADHALDGNKTVEIQYLKRTSDRSFVIGGAFQTQDDSTPFELSFDEEL